jgi:hypothetical protein
MRESISALHHAGRPWLTRLGFAVMVGGTLAGCADSPTGVAPTIARTPSTLIGAAPTGDQFGNVALMVGRTARELRGGRCAPGR